MRLQPQQIATDVSSGVITGIDSKIAPVNSVSRAINFVFDEEYGSAKVRKGSTKIGTAVNGTYNIDGLFNYIDSDGTNTKLLATAYGTTYYYNAGNWSSTLTSDTASLKTRFVAFLNTMARLNGTDIVKTWDGTGSWLSTGGALDVGNFPKGKIATVYKDQICVAGVSATPDTLYISSGPNVGATAISWTVGNRQIVVNPEDNSNIVGMGEVSDLLIIFKNRSMYRWNNRSIEADELTSVGCSSHESIATGAGMLFFFNQQGVWITTGGQPIRISRPVQAFIDGMAASYYDDVSGYSDGRYYYCAIGDVTLSDKSYTNIVLRYSIETKEWAVFSYPTKFSRFALYVDSGAEKILVGNTVSDVYQIESTALTDNATPIAFELETQNVSFSAKGVVKEIHDSVMVYGKDVDSANVSVKIDDDETMFLGTAQKTVDQIDLSEVISGHYFSFIISGSNAFSRYQFKGLELPGVTLLDYGI